MKTKSILFSLLLLAIKINAQSVNYDSRLIPDDLKKDVSQVVVYNDEQFEVTDIDYAKFHVHQVIAVLNESGKAALFFEESTDKFTKLSDFDAKLFDASGKQIARFKERDLTVNAFAEGLIDDGKTYALQINASSFPVTVEYDYEMRFKGTINYPPYQILTPHEGVEFSSYTAKVPKELDLRFKEKNIHLTPAITEEGKYKIYNWTIKNVHPVSYEEGAVSYESRYPSVLLAPNKFKVDEYEGDMTTWKNFGMWYAGLAKGANTLSAERQQFFRDLVRDAKTDREKVKIIYAYLQKNFRYVSIQLGIGGYKPFPADFTDNKKYGDCKALSNYVQTALQCVGIKSYQALINARYNKEPVDPAFPCNQFNHVIVCVPIPKDSIWLECTSRSTDFGYLGNFTENRNALLITEAGGVLVPTPKSKSSNNTLSGYTVVDIKDDGSGKTKTIFTITGEYKERINSLVDEKVDEQKTDLIDDFGFKEPGQISFNSTERSLNDAIIIDQSLESIPEFKTGSKMFLPMRVYKLWSYDLPTAENRQQDFYFSFPFEKTDTTVFVLPEGFKADALPESKKSTCQYANYSCKYWFDEKARKIYSTSKITLDQYKIPASKYADVKKFFDDILTDNQQRIVIVKK